MARKRHDVNEVASKLQRADELATNGLNQQEVARELGVSVMTIHRWRKRQASAADGQNSPLSVDLPQIRPSSARQEKEDDINQIKELELENTRLRRLVTDLLLEKMKLEEAMREGIHAAGSRTQRQ